MRVYQCDSCKKTITNPYAVKMKEFYVGANFDNGICFPVDVREKIKIHLCDDCYKGLHLIAKSKMRETMAEKEYIEREEAKKVLAFDYAYAAAELLNEVPTANVQEVRHGKWELINECANEGVYCSNCHKKVYRAKYANQKVKSNYCPNCGAKMDKE